MKLHKLGENGIIQHLQSRFNAHLPHDVLSGIGDDCAVVRLSKTEVQLITCDMLVENVHFKMESISPEALGYRALAVNLSDIAGMGGTPKMAFLSLGMPKSTDMDWLEAFFNGFQILADTHQVHLLGGDLTKSSMIVINITIIGQADPKNIRYRHLAQPGDILCTTGYLGNAGAGLRIQQNQKDFQALPKDIAASLTNSLLRPDPHIQYGKWLARHSAVHAMMDISDGIAADLPRLIAASKVGAIVNLEQLPISSQLLAAAKILNWPLYDLAIGSGEDYCLLFTADKNALPTLKTQFQECFGESLFEIGQITRDPQSLIYLNHGKAIPPPKKFDHFFNSG